MRKTDPVTATERGSTRHDAALRGLVSVYRRLSALTAGPDADLATVTAVVAADLGVLAAVVTPDGEVLAASAPGCTDREATAVVRGEAGGARWARALGAAGAAGRALRLPGDGTSVHVVAPVVVAHEVTSFVVTAEDLARRDRPDALAVDDALLLVTEHAATVAGVLAGRERVLAAAAGQVRSDLVSGLLLGRARDPDQAARWAEHLGYDASAAHRVVLISPDGSDADLLTEAAEHLARAAPGALTVVRDTEVAAIVPDHAAGDDSPAVVGARSARRLGRGRVPDPDARWLATVAVGGRATDPSALAASYDQARRTLAVAHRLGRTGGVLCFDDLGIHRLLLQVPDAEAPRAFAREVLGRLATDRSDRTVEVLRTLARYFREDGSPQRVARALSVHPNTVGYRLRRAEELSGLSLERYRDRLAAQVALEILGWME